MSSDFAPVVQDARLAELDPEFSASAKRARENAAAREPDLIRRLVLTVAIQLVELARKAELGLFGPPGTAEAIQRSQPERFELGLALIDEARGDLAVTPTDGAIQVGLASIIDTLEVPEVGLLGSAPTFVPLNLPETDDLTEAVIEQATEGVLEKGIDLIGDLVGGVTTVVDQVLPLVDLGLAIGTGLSLTERIERRAERAAARELRRAERLERRAAVPVAPIVGSLGLLEPGLDPLDPFAETQVGPFVSAGPVVAPAEEAGFIDAVTEFLLGGGILDPGSALAQEAIRLLGPGVVSSLIGGNGGAPVAGSNLPAVLMNPATTTFPRPKSQVSFIAPNGSIVHYKNMGRPLLWSGDMAACKRVAKATGKTLRRRGPR